MDGQRVLVTGGASGIGLGAVRALIDRGARVDVLDRAEPSAEVRAIADDARLTFATVDVRREDQVEDAVQQVARTWGGLDAVIHSAGVTHERRKDLREITLEAWHDIIDINLTGAFLVARACARVMIPQRNGVIVLVGSGAGVKSASGSIPYGASKGGVNGLAMTLESSLAAAGIRVHNFCPGSIDTPLFRESLADGERTTGVPEAVPASAGDPDTAGRALALLLHPDADYLRGSVFIR